MVCAKVCVFVLCFFCVFFFWGGLVFEKYEMRCLVKVPFCVTSSHGVYSRDIAYIVELFPNSLGIFY